MFKFKVVGEVKVAPVIRKNDWRWRNSTPAGAIVVAVRKDVEAGSYDVVSDFVCREHAPYLMGNSYEDKVYNTYTEALRAARRLVAKLESAADPLGA
ncbi:hypothetical protein EBZ39_04920 [bacterium]|nr:hypothetical protein [bacterium]